MDALVSIDLSQIPLSDLIEELKSRKAFEREEAVYLDAASLIDVLEDIGCPKSIISQLEEWNAQPVVDIRKLQRWKETCGVAS